MAQSLVLSSIPGEHPLFAELGDLRTEKSWWTGLYRYRAQVRVREHRAGLHSRDSGVKIRCDRELSMCGVAFPHF